jgi:hypothetical protein
MFNFLTLATALSRSQMANPMLEVQSHAPERPFSPSSNHRFTLWMTGAKAQSHRVERPFTQYLPGSPRLSAVSTSFREIICKTSIGMETDSM